MLREAVPASPLPSSSSCWCSLACGHITSDSVPEVISPFFLLVGYLRVPFSSKDTCEWIKGPPAGRKVISSSQELPLMQLRVLQGNTNNKQLLSKLLSNLLFSRFSHVQLIATPWTVAHQAPLSMGFSGQEYWSGFPFPSPVMVESSDKTGSTGAGNGQSLQHSCLENPMNSTNSIY